MPENKEVNVGIICQTLVQQHHIRHLVHQFGFDSQYCFIIDQLLKETDRQQHLTSLESVDFLIVDVDASHFSQDSELGQIESWLYNLRMPVIFGEGITYNPTDEGFQSWSRQLYEKIFNIHGQLNAHLQKYSKPKHIWVLAASMGGPEAVKQFLDKLPIGLQISFVYVQHLQTTQQKSLAKTLCRDSKYTAIMAEDGDSLKPDHVTIIPADQEVIIMPTHIMMFRDTPWRGPYKPSIDQVVANIAESYHQRSGVIYFSGMGDDGVAGARLMARRGGTVWIQAPDSCTSDAMPSAVNATECVSMIGTPEQLAANLRALHQHKKAVTT